MAYDFGSQTLGIQNPFKTEGKIRFVAGLILLVFGIIPLLKVSAELKQEPVYGYTYAILGFILIANGLKHCGQGLFQLFKFFVGRSVPTSLAYNRSRSERDTANAEKASTMYSDERLHSMLMGRKNSTFVEPIGWISRFIHSLLPNLIFLPYRLRFLAQSLARMVINFCVALLCFGIVYFVVATGMAGELAQHATMPVFSIILLVYLVIEWHAASKQIAHFKQTNVPSNGSFSLGVLIVLSVLVPVLTGFALDSYSGLEKQDIINFFSENDVFSATGNLLLLLLAVALAMVVLPALFIRLKEVTPSTEVSEYRSNMQENVHPNEIFINIENIVLANRRYKEIPNRVYREFDPRLNEQAEGKGNFAGELLIETQPIVAQKQPFEGAQLWKILSSVFGQVCMLVGFIFLYKLGFVLAEITKTFMNEDVSEIVSLISSALFYTFSWLTFSTAGRVLNSTAHLLWGEILFSSLLMYMKTEGTYTESKISTGMSIHDSTRSENVVVRSSITPWIITSQLTTSIFATSGSGNLESPRLITGMHKTEEELGNIVEEIVSFLRGRESIASITNESDLDNAGTIHQINEQSRANNNSHPQIEKQNQEAAGFLRNDPTKKDDGHS